MKKNKKLLTVILSFVLVVGACFGFVGCKDTDAKYKVTQEEYEAAFTSETLSNVTICTVGYENVHLKEKYYCVGDNYAFYNYYDNLQFYGKFYEIKNGEESCYLYGNEDFECFTEDDATWRKSETVFDKNSLFHNAKFVALYKIAFDLLEYDMKEKCYRVEIPSQEHPFSYTYYFLDKKLTKIEITSSANENYYRIMEFYDYGTTKIPEEIDIETPDKSIIPLSPEIESQFDLSQEKIWWNSNTNIDFADDKIVVCFKNTTIYPELSIEDFSCENAESIEYMFLRPTDGKYENAENYTQIAVINLKEKGRDRVIEAVRYFERISIILFAQPNYIYGIEED